MKLLNATEKNLYDFCHLFDFKGEKKLTFDDYVPIDPFHVLEFDRTKLATLSVKDLLDFLVSERITTFYSYSSFKNCLDQESLCFKNFDKAIKNSRIPMKSRYAFKLSNGSTLKTEDELIFLILYLVQELVLTEKWKITDIDSLISNNTLGQLFSSLNEKVRIRCISQVSPYLLSVPGIVDLNTLDFSVDFSESDDVRDWDKVLLRFTLLLHFLNKDLLFKVNNKRFQEILCKNDKFASVNPLSIQRMISKYKKMIKNS